jgi:hypothetical protein
MPSSDDPQAHEMCAAGKLRRKGGLKKGQGDTILHPSPGELNGLLARGQ